MTGQKTRQAKRLRDDDALVRQLRRLATKHFSETFLGAGSFVPGWITEDDLFALGRYVKSVPTGHVVEVGVALGRTTTAIAAKALDRGCSYFAVDTFSGSDDPDDMINELYSVNHGHLVRSAFEANCRALRLWEHINLIEEHSVEAAKRFADGQIAMCFIDADHTYDAVMQDIAAWWPKVMPMGVMCGHDRQVPAVWKAVMEFVGRERVGAIQEANVWAIQKPGS
jgi:predicted O-methyltransferase YrrM